MGVLVSRRDQDESWTEPGIVPGLKLSSAEASTPAGLESRVMLQRARARLLGRDETPVRIGRYVIVERIGAGAMGVVLRAYDPKLRREVALKIVRPRAGMAGHEAQVRLLREAQALARLAHPNVVAVYDAEITPDGVSIAMEYVEGRTLRAWLRERKRAWPEMLPMILSVARGLAAAHAAGLVHRDVKPDNCLVGRDERLRVTDFGLARVTEGTPSSLAESVASADEDDEPLTQDGTVVGTPAYMAPEQHLGSTADARTDQYALGVLMWEALHGSRPFRGPALETFASAKRRGAPDRPPNHVPNWLHAIVVRALAVQPEQRWPSVATLADALVSASTRVRRRRAFVAVAGVATTLAGLAGWQQIERHRIGVACEDEGASIYRDVWDEAQRSRLREGMLGTRVGHAAATYDLTLAWIERYLEHWQEARVGVCAAARVHGRLSPELFWQAQQCLDDRRDGLDTLVDVLAEGEGASAQRAVMAVGALPMLEPCVDPVALVRRPHGAETRESSARAAELRRTLHRARSLASVERREEALALSTTLIDEAATAGFEALELEATALAGDLAGRSGDYEASEVLLRRALVNAGVAGLDEIAADAAIALVSTIGVGLGRHAAGLAHGDTARLLVHRIEPDGHGPRHIRLLDNLALVHLAAGTHDEAERLYAHALEISEATVGADHPAIATQLGLLAAVVHRRGAHDEAERLYTRAQAILEARLGFDHPDVAAYQEAVHSGLPPSPR